jgi:hypothetical protein
VSSRWQTSNNSVRARTVCQGNGGAICAVDGPNNRHRPPEGRVQLVGRGDGVSKRANVNRHKNVGPVVCYSCRNAQGNSKGIEVGGLLHNRRVRVPHLMRGMHGRYQAQRSSCASQLAIGLPMTTVPLTRRQLASQKRSMSDRGVVPCLGS